MFLVVDVGEEGRIRTICSGLVKFVPLEEMQVCLLVGAASEATLSSSPLRFAVYVGIIVRATRGQRSLCLPCQQFLNYCSQDCWQVGGEFWLDKPAGLADFLARLAQPHLCDTYS